MKFKDYPTFVSVIIPTYNRFKNVLHCIESVKNQTHKNLEIIVVNDGSGQNDYYEHDWGDIKIIHLEKNTRQLFGYPCVGYVINRGIEEAKGDHIAFLDDDDYWLPKKLELQLESMEKYKYKMSCTEGFWGKGMYNSEKKYKKYNSEVHYNTLKQIYKRKGKGIFLENGFPKIWNLEFLKVHNCIIASSVIISKDIINKIGRQLEIKMGGVELNNTIVHIDYDYWLRALVHTNCVYIDEPCVYYDDEHGGGQEWKIELNNYQIIKSKYEKFCNKKSDINEHLPTLYHYSTKCESIIETGVRGVISSYALIYGLLNNNNINRKILLNDITECDIQELLSITKDLNINLNYKWINNLDLEIDDNYDLTFIDTWHVYGQLKRELKKFSKITNKYIILHDTTVDADYGETIRNGWDAEKQSLQSGIPVDEINKGLWPAIVEFVENNNNWIIKERFTNNNGLTVLEKI